jgi:four helix bundle protein
MTRVPRVDRIHDFQSLCGTLKNILGILSTPVTLNTFLKSCFKITPMENKEFAKQLEIRTKQFAIRIIKLSATLPSTPEGRVVKNQLTKSGTSIGENYREANRSRSKADFYNKIQICESESSETAYWLEIALDMNWSDSTEINLMLVEANELLAIFTSVSNKLKAL